VVNSLYDLFDAPGTKPDAEQLIVNGRYKLPPIGDPTGERRSLQRVTNFVKQISDSEGLTKWRLRQVVLGLALREDLYDLACSLDPMQKSDTDRVIEQAIEAAKSHGSFTSGANETGTALHNYTDNAGHEPARVRPKWAPKIENYRRALHDHGLIVVPGLSERLVASERYGTAGRLDDVYEDVHGARYVADRKSQKEFYTWFEIGAQLALYQCSDAMWNEQTSSWEDMPNLNPDRAIVAWMPLRHPGPDPEAVEMYWLPLAEPRKLLDEILLVRTLRTEARKWAWPMSDLPRWERNARDIRDAQTHEDLRELYAERAVPGAWDHRLDERAAQRWEEISAQQAAAELGGAPATPLAPGVAVHHVSGYAAQASIGVAVADVRPSIPAALPDIGQVFPIAPTPDVIAACEEESRAYVEAQTPPVWEQLAALFQAPAQEATFPADQGDRVPDDAGATVSAPVLSEPRPELGIASGWVDGEGVLRTPHEWCAHLELDQAALSGISAVDRTHPFTLKDFREFYASVSQLKTPAQWAAELGVRIVDPDGWRGGPGRFVAKDFDEPLMRSEFQARMNGSTVEYLQSMQAHPIATAPHITNANGIGTVVELPDDAPTSLPTSTSDYAAAVEALDSVPIKVVREVCTRARNSESSRGRVRLLNDVEEKKYTAHRAALMPALLREWLEIDGLRGEPGFNKDGVPRVANTGGSKREPMDARAAGKLSLSRYLELKGEEVPDGTSKKGSAEPAQGDTSTDAFGQPISEAALDMISPEEPGLEPYAVDEPLAEQQIRHQYENIEPDKHSIKRLVELAQKAANGAERAKVFHEITRRKAWTGQIAAEINQYYLDNGYATVDFDPYFEATALPSGTATQVVAADEPPLPGLPVTPARPDGPVLNGNGKQVMPQDGPLGGFRQVYRGGEIVTVGGPLTVAEWIAQGWATHAGDEELLTVIRRCASMDSLQALWSTLSTLPAASDQRIRDALMEKFQKLNVP
jgi:hypothetical protein